MRKFKVRVNGEEFEVEVSEVNESREDGKIRVEKIKRIPHEITATSNPMREESCRCKEKRVNEFQGGKLV